MKIAVAFALATAGCASTASAPTTSAPSPSQQCASANAFSRVARGIAGKPNASADAIEDLNCGVLAAEERADARARQAERVQFERAQSAANQRTDEILAQIRRAPTVPEVGSTVAEATVMCTQQRGALVNRPAAIGCKIRSDTLFACSFDESGRIDRVDAYIEGATLAAMRASVEARNGLPTRESVSKHGFRVFEWTGETHSVVLTTYPRGVRLTNMKPMPAESLDE